jgi:hypothetical protein
MSVEVTYYTASSCVIIYRSPLSYCCSVLTESSGLWSQTLGLIHLYFNNDWQAGIAQSVCLCWVGYGWTVRNSNPGRGKRFFFSTNRPDRLWGPLSLQFNEYRGSFPGIKQPGCDVDHSPPSGAQIKNEAVLLLLCMPLWREQGQFYIFSESAIPTSRCWRKSSIVLMQIVYISTMRE